MLIATGNCNGDLLTSYFGTTDENIGPLDDGVDYRAKKGVNVYLYPEGG
jgi:hypothetical protein